MIDASAPPHWTSTASRWPNAEASAFIRAGTTTWHVQRMGSGHSVLLLHGSGAATHSWRDLLPNLARTFDVVAPDLPHHGFSRAPVTAVTLPGMAKELAALLAEMKLRPRLIIGHSAGAAVAIRMALDGAVAPRAIIGINAALTPFRGIAGMLFPSVAKLLALNPLLPWAFSRLAASKEKARKIIEGTGSYLEEAALAEYASLLSRPEHVRGALSMMANWDLEPLLRDLPKLGIPLHLIVADGDRAVPPIEAQRLSRSCPMIVLHEISGYGHLLHEEAPDLTADLIREIAAGREGLPES